MGSLRIIGLFVALAAGLVLPAQALAWGELGHRVIADLAYEQLTPRAKARVDAIIAAKAVREPGCAINSLADAEVFPDCVSDVGKYRRYARLHYDNISLCEPKPKPDYCHNGECASEAVKKALGVLRDPAAKPDQQLLALAETANFLGDLHQPLNAADNRDDRGARVRVTLPGSSDKALNLRELWDQQLETVAAGSEELGLRYLRPTVRAHQKDWTAGDPDSWAQDSHNLAQAFVYARLPTAPQCGKRGDNKPQSLDRVYVVDATAVVRDQLARASVHLAAALNAALQ